MYVVTVEFRIQPGYFDQFLSMLVENARRSREEPGCVQFDICTSSERPEVCFLYEIYKSRPEFDQHLASDHFQDFDAALKGMVASKTVSAWALVAP